MKDDSFRDFVLDQLHELEDIGGFGLYRDETFFGIIHKGRLYFKVDESSASEYRRRRMRPLRPNAKQTLKSYYQVPVEIIEDAEKLAGWAKRAINCQHRHQRRQA